MEKGAITFPIALLDSPHPGGCHRRVTRTEPLSALLHPALLPANTDLFPGAYTASVVSVVAVLSRLVA